MGVFVNFKIQDDYGKMQHCCLLDVFRDEYLKDYYEGKYVYRVKALSYDNSIPERIGGDFETPSEAFAFMERIEEKYPRYNDERDYDIEYAPVFDINLFKEPCPTSAAEQQQLFYEKPEQCSADNAAGESQFETDYANAESDIIIVDEEPYDIKEAQGMEI